LNVPKLIAQDIAQGFLLLSDLGDYTYLSQINAQNASTLYGDAYHALIQMQLASKPNVLPPYDEALLTREMQLFPDWYISKHLGFELDVKQEAVLQATFAVLNRNILSQPQVYVHRDYHARNLMVTQDNNPGILDFQDAVYGPITYDLVSLFKDAYISWDEEIIMDWVVRYWQSAKKAGLTINEDFGAFYRDFEYMGAQRHIKVLGIFARLYHRDGKEGYLKDMPLVMQYLRRVCERYVELRPMLRLLDTLDGREQRPKYVV
jgi:N-acetylmuramate 1-kinase